MIDIQVSPELCYALRLLWCLCCLAVMNLMSGMVVDSLHRGHKGRAASYLTCAIIWTFTFTGALWYVTQWYARLAELRGW